MYKPLRTSDGNVYNVTNDTDFHELLRNYLGDDSAEWYKDRIMAVDHAVEEIRNLMGNIVEKTLPSGVTVYDNASLENLSKEKLIEIGIIAWEIAGWDQ